jgi:hypothetical protein
MASRRFGWRAAPYELRGCLPESFATLLEVAELVEAGAGR